MSDTEICTYKLFGPVTGFVIITSKFYLESQHTGVTYFHSQEPTHVGLNFITFYGNHTVQFFAICSALPRVFFPLCAILARFFLAHLLWSPWVNSLPSCSKWVRSAQTASSCDCWAGYPHTVGEILATPSKAVRNSWQILSRWEPFPLSKDPPISIYYLCAELEKCIGSEDWIISKSALLTLILSPVPQKIIKISLQKRANWWSPDWRGLEGWVKKVKAIKKYKLPVIKLVMGMSSTDTEYNR